MRNDAVAPRKWSFHDSTISDNVKRCEVRRCHTLREGVTLSSHRNGEGTALQNGTTFHHPGDSNEAVRLPLREFSIITITKLDQRKANGRSADVGITQLCIVRPEAKKKLLAAFTVLSLSYFKETTVQEDKCARFL